MIETLISVFVSVFHLSVLWPIGSASSLASAFMIRCLQKQAFYAAEEKPPEM